MLRGMAIPVMSLALILGIGGAWVIDQSVQTVNDRILSAASRAIVDSLTVEDGAIGLNLSPAIFGMLEDAARDNVYYSVRHRGRILTGYRDLPDVAPPTLGDTKVAFGDAVYLGRRVRVVAEARRLPQIDGVVIVQVAETLDARRRIANRLLAGLVVLELLLIGTTLALLPLAIRWGLRPLHRVRGEMDRRAASDLGPLALDQVPAELRDLVRAFNAMLARLDSAIAGIRRFTADASHQMRTPLSILRTHIALLRCAEPGSAAADDSIDDIDHASDRLQHLIVQLLALARADSADRSRVDRAAVDANEIAAEAASEHAVSAVRAGIDFTFERLPGVLAIVTNRIFAVEMIGNLIDNAIKHNTPGGSVRITLEAHGDHVSVAVEDDGPGIPLEERANVFTRFTRLHRDPSLGSGLGLSIAEALATAVGARLALETPASGRGLRAVASFSIAS
jgi:two-component system sensor histidine kinase TctE